MPYGGRFDACYKEIYARAIRDSGLEAFRADSLFAGGAVVAQIWAEIQVARVLLADLTGKNPNVFYELGLAHALGKPVVIVAENIDDVPFDVRHLRVLTFDVHQPNWSTRLRRDLKKFLQNALAEPQGAVHHAFQGTALLGEGP